MNLSAFISPQAHIARSVNLERDQDSHAGLLQYRLTGKGLEILSRFVAALAGEPVSAWSLTGPYGMGKSSFARFFLALVGSQEDPATELAWDILGRRDKQLSRQLLQLMHKHKAHPGGFFRIGVTASFEPLNRTLVKGMLGALRNEADDGGSFMDIVGRAEALAVRERIETPDVVELTREVIKKKGTPLVFVIDEFGKNLEYMARFSAQGDLFILQILAETSGIYLWVCLHQAFEEYTSRLSQRQMQEWAKIQGRFEDISFVEPRREMLGFIGQTLIHVDGKADFARAVRRWAETYIEEARRLSLAEFQGMDADTFESFYPIHPLAAVLLPELCVRFAQNDRTLFSFLCSGEPTALPAFLFKARVDTVFWNLPTLGLERLYDYFLSSVGGGILGRPEAQRWIEIHDLIERSRSTNPDHLIVLKTIGLLNMVSGPSGFRASSSLLSFAYFRPSTNGSELRCPLANIIHEAQEKGILIYREYADEYRLWEGSDFDISRAMRQRRALLATQSLENVLKEAYPLSAMTASRHSFITGNLRHFERRWISVDSLSVEEAFRCVDDLDGLILYAFGKEPKPSWVPSTTEDGRPILVCYVPCEDEIRDAVLDCAAAQAVLCESPELVRDGVARKEAAFRADIAEQRLRSLLESIFILRNQDAQWFVMGQPEKSRMSSERDLSRVLSDCCDLVYADAPWIRNELINRNRLSTVAARARRELMEAMVLRPAEFMLGFEGTGPEVAIYRTMFLQEKLHCQGANGRWFFQAPGADSRYRKVFELLDRIMEESGGTPVEVTQLMEHLKRPPFGIKEGPIPVFLCFYLMVRLDDIALYQGGAFIPHLGPEDMELLSKRPELFSIKHLRADQANDMVLSLYSNLIRTRLQEEAQEGWRNPSLLAVISPLIQFAKKLPKYTVQTHQVSSDAQRVRQALLLARDPLELLFVELPRAVGMPSFRISECLTEENFSVFQERFRKAVMELRDAYQRLLRTVEHVILQVFDYNGEVATLRNSLRERAQGLVDCCGDPDLNPFVKILAGFSGDQDAWIASIATLVTRRPVDSWRDDDLKSFGVALADMVHRFRNLETMTLKLDGRMSQGEGGRSARMVTLSYPDGASLSGVVWKDKLQDSSIFKVVEKLLKEYGQDRLFLESLFVALGERLLATSSDSKQDVSDVKEK